MRNTLTLDKGKEFAAHKALSQALALDIYFAHPYHSWKRGLNEHTKELIRQYLPKKTPFDTLTQKQLDISLIKSTIGLARFYTDFTGFEDLKHKYMNSKCGTFEQFSVSS
jgi:hypothetical protein